ncbi:hypothetical protein B0H67DRAFT_551754 [Lasiosphaeris hirsuta]|uniref:Uncharacterized protein n=1 Tax=Lasiosphaeris hirsuta TaxID=260670 RepID=A0AA40DXM6_9PEZI|nr:hypothetical protein B0H67DRAFT_551754 [Lasiosphaeris hirsuta]
MASYDVAILFGRQLRLTNDPRLDDLSVEVQAMILSNLDSPEDLLAAILSCRSLYRGYQASHKQILRAVLANAAGPSLHDLVGLANLPRFQQGDSRVIRQVAGGGNLVPIFWAKIGDHAERHFNQANTWEMPRTIGEARRVCHPMHLINAFIAEYLEFFRSMAKHRTPILSRLFTTRQPDNSAPTIPRVAHVARGEAAIRREASADEMDRLRRGFIRYELLCGMTSIPHWTTLADYCDLNKEDAESGLNFHDFSTASLNRYQPTDFFAHLSVAECEEVMAVAEYVHCQYRKMIGESRRALDSSITIHEEEPTGQLQRDHHTALQYATRGQTFNTRSGRWDSYHPRWRHLCQPETTEQHTDMRWILPGLGLGLLRQMLQSTKAERILLIRDAASAFAPDRATGLEHRQDPQNTSYADLAVDLLHTSAVQAHFDQSSNGTAPTAAAHPGLVAALDVMWHNVHATAYGTPQAVTTRLRLGCVFWDADRVLAVKPTRAGRVMSLAGPAVAFGDEGEWAAAECVVAEFGWHNYVEPAFATHRFADGPLVMDAARHTWLEILLDWVRFYGPKREVSRDA